MILIITTLVFILIIVINKIHENQYNKSKKKYKRDNEYKMKVRLQEKRTQQYVSKRIKMWKNTKEPPHKWKL